MSKYYFSIGTKLIALVLVVSVTSITITTILAFNVADDIIKKNVKDSLLTESVNRGDAISSIIETRISQVQDLSQNQVIIQTLKDLFPGLDDITFNRFLNERHDSIKSEIEFFQLNLFEAGLRDLKIINLRGKPIFSLNEIISPQTYVRANWDINKPEIEFFQDSDQNPLMKISTPIKQESQSNSLGMIIATMGTSVFDSILMDRYGLQQTGEVYLVNKDYFLISESLFIEQGEFRQKVDTLPVRKCFENGEEINGMVYTDYRGVDIFGVSYCKNDLGFVLLTEVDESVILEPVYELQKLIVIIGISIIAIASIVTFVLSKRLSKPILKLRDAANKISEGDFNIKTEIKTNDEIGQLSSSFDSMVKTIRETISAITRRDDIIKSEENILLQFSKAKQECCVCLVDMIGSLAITKTLSEENKKKYYKIFKDTVLNSIKKYNGIPVKFINDAILFYFPSSGSNEIFSQAIECCLTIAELNKELNEKMKSENLPGIGYRISVTFGLVHIVGAAPIQAGEQMELVKQSSNQDIFGDVVNACFKINQYALPNTVVIDYDMYEKAKESNFIFTLLDKSIIKELDYQVYLVSKKIGFIKA